MAKAKKEDSLVQEDQALMNIRAELGQQGQTIGYLKDTLFDSLNRINDEEKMPEFWQGALGVLVSLKNALTHASRMGDGLVDAHHDILEQSLALQFAMRTVLMIFDDNEIDETVNGIVGTLVSLEYSLRFKREDLNHSPGKPTG